MQLEAILDHYDNGLIFISACHDRV